MKLNFSRLNKIERKMSHNLFLPDKIFQREFVPAVGIVLFLSGLGICSDGFTGVL